ncbi:hypothetical protein BS47DRAFT_1361534 [Hydnum rufescens UP504]|uniref:Uncharacterized protein n=1 Tax=Hydnum rufescens UP504 TaxID=1448309 RepID=A0A9P6AZP7_9AGAM|nr:hypothetical protein BS47DRAFT_1361534 [Hydnum rufescens UP504]
MSSWFLDVLHASLGANKSDSSDQALTKTPKPEYASYPHSQTPFTSVPQGFSPAPVATPRTIKSGGGGDAEGKSAFGGNGGNITVSKEIPTDSALRARTSFSPAYRKPQGNDGGRERWKYCGAT